MGYFFVVGYGDFFVLVFNWFGKRVKWVIDNGSNDFFSMCCYCFGYGWFEIWYLDYVFFYVILEVLGFKLIVYYILYGVNGKLWLIIYDWY